MTTDVTIDRPMPNVGPSLNPNLNPNSNPNLNSNPNPNPTTWVQVERPSASSIISTANSLHN